MVPRGGRLDSHRRATTAALLDTATGGVRMRRPAVGNGRNLYLHVGDFLSQELPPWLAAHKGVNPKAMTRRETELYHLAKTYPINSRRGYARAVVRTQLPCRIRTNDCRCRTQPRARCRRPRGVSPRLETDPNEREVWGEDTGHWPVGTTSIRPSVTCRRDGRRDTSDPDVNSAPRWR